MQTVIETPEFVLWACQIWPDPVRLAFIDWFAAHPDAGDVIPGTGGLRKVRWSRSGMGKRGGARVIYFIRRDDGTVVLLIAYAKAKFDNLRPEFLKLLKDRHDPSHP